MKQPLVLRITRAFYNYACTTDFHKFTFTFMHLADTFIQSNLQCFQVIHFMSVCQYCQYKCSCTHTCLNYQMSNREVLINL